MRVLIAHSSSAERTALADAVPRDEGEPLDIVQCANGHEALDVLLGDDAPELAVVDWDLPGIEGPEMCRLVRDFHQGHATQLVILASPEHADTADAWRAGAAQCISTPAPASEIGESMRQGLRAARERRAAHCDRGRPTLEAVRAPELDDAGGFFRVDDAEPPPAAAPDRASLLQAVLVER